MWWVVNVKAGSDIGLPLKYWMMSLPAFTFTTHHRNVSCSLQGPVLVLINRSSMPNHLMCWTFSKEITISPTDQSTLMEQYVKEGGSTEFWWLQIACPATTCTQTWGGRLTYHHMNSIMGRSICQVPHRWNTFQHSSSWNVCSLDIEPFQCR